jgi:hypothetical protein
MKSNTIDVMAGLVPAIHVFAAKKGDVDARHKAGHDAFRVANLLGGSPIDTL